MTQALLFQSFDQAEDLPREQSRYGRDEINLAQFPLVALADRAPFIKDPITGKKVAQKTLSYQDTIQDPRTGKSVQRKVTITGSDKYGLPTARDEEVMVSLIKLTKEVNEFTDQKVGFTRQQLFQILGWSDQGKNYQRLRDSLHRWNGTLIVYEGWWDPSNQRFREVSFSLLNTVVLFDERARARPANREEQMGLPLSFFEWNQVIFRNFQQNYKELDTFLYFQLSSFPAKRALRYLDAELPTDGSQRSFGLRDFACEHIGMSRQLKPVRLVADLRATVVEPLVAAGFIQPMREQDRFVKTGRSYTGVVFARSMPLRPPAEIESQLGGMPGSPAMPDAAGTSSPLVAELGQRGISRKVATEFVAKHPEDYLRRKIEVFDWLMEKQPDKLQNNPAGYLVKSIRDDWEPPKGFTPREEREKAQKAAEEARKANEENKRQKEAAKQRKEKEEAAARQAKRDHIDAYLETLPPEELDDLKKRAVAHANEHQRPLLNRGGHIGSVMRQLLIDEEVLRLCPLAE